jgi:hypothetical protein
MNKNFYRLNSNSDSRRKDKINHDRSLHINKNH